MSVPFQGEISLTIRSEQLRNSTAATADRQHDEHRVIANAWLQRAIDGIQQMHRDEDVRREVAGRILAAWGRLADDHDRRNSDDRIVAFDEATNDEPGTRPGSSHSCCRPIAGATYPSPALPFG